MIITVPSGAQWVVIILAVLLVFGAHRLPAAASHLGASIRRFREAYRGDTPPSDDQP
jgi:sec-independent protein translocase protein TatA